MQHENQKHNSYLHLFTLTGYDADLLLGVPKLKDLQWLWSGCFFRKQDVKIIFQNRSLKNL